MCENTSRSIDIRVKRRRQARPTLRRSGRLCLLVSALLMTAAIVEAQPGAVRMHEGKVQRGVIEATSFAGVASRPSLDVESSPITVSLPSGKPYGGYLILVHAPESGLYWWTFEGAGPGDPTDRIANLRARMTFYVSDYEIVSAQVAAPPPSLWILASASRAPSLEAARSVALAQIGRSAERIEKGTTTWLREISLWGALKPEFFYSPEHANARLEMTVTGLERRPGGWAVSLAGRQGRTARILLDDLFVLVSAQESGS